MKSFIISALLLFTFQLQMIACCGADPISLTELLVSTTDPRAILEITVDTTWIDQQGANWSIATVDRAYKNKPLKQKITIRSGGNSSAGGARLGKGGQYLLVSAPYDGETYGGFVCDKFSRFLNYTERYRNETFDHLKFIKSYFEKVENKHTGPVSLEYDGKVFMRGKLINGIPHGIFEHFEAKVYGEKKGQHALKSIAIYENGLLDGSAIDYVNSYNGDYETHKYFSEGQLEKTERWYSGKLQPYRKYSQQITYRRALKLTEVLTMSGEDTLQLEESYIQLANTQRHYYYTDVFKKIKHGVYRQYNKDGVLIIDGAYFWGAKVDHWTWYKGDGAIEKENSFEKPIRPAGLITIYHENGKVKAQGKSKDDMLDGQWQLFDVKGELLCTPYFENGLLNGTVKSKRQHSTSIDNYKHGKKDGNCKRYNRGKLSATSNYKAGNREGKFETFDKNKQLKSVTNYKNNDFHGLAMRISETGDTVNIRNYKDGYLDGYYRIKNPRKCEEGYYEMGFRIGEWIFHSLNNGRCGSYTYPKKEKQNINRQEIKRENYRYLEAADKKCDHD